MTIAQTILAQLGGNRFAVMTGAKNFLDGGNYLFFSIGRNSTKINRVRITLMGNDTYTVEFLRMYKLELKEVVAPIVGVYAEQLQPIFKQHTGMDTHL